MLESDKRLIKNTSILLAVFITLSFISCKNGEINTEIQPQKIKDFFKSDAFDANAIMPQLFAKDGICMFETDTFNMNSAIRIMYDSTENNPIWVNGKGISDNGNTLLSILDSIDIHGLTAKAFWYDTLSILKTALTNQPNIANATKAEKYFSVVAYKLAKSLKNGYFTPGSFTKEYYNKTDSNFNAAAFVKRIIEKDSLKYMSQMLEPKIDLYKKLKTKLAQLKITKSAGGWPTNIQLKDSIVNGTENDQITWLRKRLNKELGTPKDTISKIMDDGLLADIKTFQYLYDLKVTGKIDTTTLNRLNRNIDQQINIVKTNMERCRWIKSELQQPYVWVNIPRMELSYFNHDSLEYQMRVVVGRSGRPTPTLDAQMTNLVINPGWSVPPTIMEQEIIPGIAKRGGSFLARRGLKAFLGGREVNASAINAKNYKRYSIQQKPGLNSALGVVKFNMPNRHAIYLHDTPHREDFVKYFRAFSSGCIRVHHPREFAAFLLNDTNYTKPKIDSFVKRKTPKEVPLKDKVNVHIVYITNDLDSLGNIKYLRDIYGYDKNFSSAWN